MCTVERRNVLRVVAPKGIPRVRLVVIGAVHKPDTMHLGEIHDEWEITGLRRVVDDDGQAVGCIIVQP